MPDARLPRITARDLVRALKRGGWVTVRTTGSHIHLRHPERGALVTVPGHVGETIGPGLLKSILDQAGLAPDELKELL
ncbi:MAG TPA: type II toxin-antitoxin system HicA family toxin [Thermomicrobiales bacterium]|nr:type II toxin-antitoxin system HicA family toxin [Thermomicrobiales bacterium]